MDFQDLLAQASHNAQASTRHVLESNREAQLRKLQERRRFESELQKEREDRKRKVPPKIEKRFVIPKKKPATEDNVNPDGVQAFIRKQKQMDAEKEIEKRKERDRLISLRLQANQGRANKKIASQFGKSAIELQQKYAHNSNRELELMKRQQREDEELERKGKQIRESINRAVESRAGKLAKTPQTSSSKGSTRVGNVKAGGFAALSAKHESVTTKQKVGDELRTASSSRGSAAKPNSPPKRPSTGTSALTYNDLMEAAKKNREGMTKTDRLNEIFNGRPRSESTKTTETSEVVKRTVDSSRRPPPLPASSSSSAVHTTLKTPQLQIKAATKMAAEGKNPYAEADRRAFGPPPAQKTPLNTSISRAARPMPSIPQPPPAGGRHSNPSMFGGQKKEQRFLPGDLRYKPPTDPPPAAASSNGAAKPKIITFADRFRKMDVPSAQTSSSSTQSTPAIGRQAPTSPSAPPQQSTTPKWKTAATKKLGFPGAFRGRPVDPTAFDSTVRVQRPDDRSVGRPADRDRRAAAEVLAARSKPKKRPAEAERSRRPISHPGMFNKNRAHVPSSSFVSGGMYSDEEEYEEDDRYDDYEDEHDSEMDDFIDDTELDDWQTADFEESLKMVNRNYNKKKWEMRERMIDERRMDARFRDVEAEEKRSARAAMYEDLMEAKRGSKGIA